MNIDRVNSELQRQISDIIMHELKDPRVSGFLTVLGVKTTQDLKYAKVFISYFGDEDKRKGVFEGLNSSAGYIRSLLKTRVKMRTLPELRIIEDNSSEYAFRINKVINEANKTKDGGDAEL